MIVKHLIKNNWHLKTKYVFIINHFYMEHLIKFYKKYPLKQCVIMKKNLLKDF